NNTYGDVNGHCSDFGIGCVVPTTINLPVSDLLSGSNTIEFDVVQHNWSFGLDYSGYVTSVHADDAPVNTPEPGSAMLLGSGLLMLGLVAFSKRRATSLN